MVHRGDLIVKQVWIGLVEIDALLDDRFVIGMERDAGCVVNARSLEAAGLDREGVEAPITIRIEPFADG